MSFRPDRFHLASPVSPPATGGSAPDAPTGFAMQSRTDTTINVAWVNLPEEVTARIMWRQSAGDWGEFEQPNLSLPYFGLTSLTPNTSYDVRIRTERGGLASDWVTLTDIFTFPSTPSNFAAASSVYTAVNLTWDNQVGVTWKLYRDSMEVYSGEVTPRVDYTGSPNQVFGYALKAIGNISGLESAMTDTVYGTSGAGSAPGNTVAPSASSLSGTGFTTTAGIWTGDPAPGFLYQWQIDPSAGAGDPYWENVAGANDPELPSATIGYYYRCRVTGSNALGEVPAFSNPVILYPA